MYVYTGHSVAKWTLLWMKYLDIKWTDGMNLLWYVFCIAAKISIKTIIILFRLLLNVYLFQFPAPVLFLCCLYNLGIISISHMSHIPEKVYQ